jgi:hypothetical protein
MMLIRTRYIGSNIGLLIAGALVCLATGFMAVMTAGFGTDPVHDFRSAAVVCDLLVVILSIPFYLAMFRWCGIGMFGVWCAAFVSLGTCLVSGMAGFTVFFTLLLGVQGLI